ncbi:MFS transporter [Desulfovibrio sp. OttesenSCG-928-C06]|nr:MFS transporter [Desulfovibrio sp. OttesenSCG-928-C06]
MKNKFLPLALSIYVNYILIGICVIIINQNIDILMAQMGTDRAGIGWVVSGMGIGKLIIMLFGGALSDKFGRKPFIFIGQIGFVLFFLGVMFSTSVAMGFALSVLCGMSNSFIDSSGMPALMECFPNSPGTASIMVKAFVSMGQFAMPMFIMFIYNNNMWFGWSFIACSALMALNALFLLTRGFPGMDDLPPAKAADGTVIEQADKPRFFPEGICLSLIGYTSTASFTIMLLWLPIFGSDIAGMEVVQAKGLVSHFAIGSLCAVFSTAFLVKRMIKPIYFVFAYPLVAAVVLFLVYMYPSPSFCITAAYILGFTAGGGVLQLALAAMAELFTFGKGKITSAVYTLNNISIFTVPIITGYLAQTNAANIILFDAFLTAFGAILALVVLVRYRKIYPGVPVIAFSNAKA